MSKKSMGLGKSNDYSAGMRANAQKLMPEMSNVKNMKTGGKAQSSGTGSKSPRTQPPGLGVGTPPGVGTKKPASKGPMTTAQAGPAMKKGGRACFAIGGVAKLRKGEASKSGSPQPPKVKFHGKPGVRGG